MGHHQNIHEDSFSIGGTDRRWTAEDLDRFEERLSEAQAHLEEVSKVSTPPASPPASRHRTLPEHFADFQERLTRAEAKLEEASTAARACEAAVEEVADVPPEELARLEEALSAARDREAEARAEADSLRPFVDRLREALPENEEAEAQARVAWAESNVRSAERQIDEARADLLPEPCLEALKLLAEHAADVWLERYATSDEARRKVVKPTIAMNIKNQLATTMFRPQLAALDDAINITSNPEPPPQGDNSPAASVGPAETLNRLTFGRGE